MAKIKIRKVVQSLDLDDYYGSGESEIIRVWVNPPRAIREQHNENVTNAREVVEQMSKVDPDDAEAVEKLAERLQSTAALINGFWSTLWSQDRDESTHWSPEEVAQLQKDCNDHDPGLWQFITTMSIGMMNDYISGNQKKGKRR